MSIWTFAARRRGRWGVPIPIIVALALVGCSGGGGGVSGISATPTMDMSEPVVSSESGPCAGGRLVVGALMDMQPAWDEGVATAQEKAIAWQEDATLVEAQVECAFLGSGVDVKGRFYSGEARAYFASYTGVTTPIDPGVPEPPRLIASSVSFERLSETLLAADIDPTAEIHPTSGINIRYNGTTTPFGPPGSPGETVIVHLIVVTNGDQRDIFVETRDWQILEF